MAIEQYFSNPALSQSKLKLLLTSPKLFNTVEAPELYYEEKKYFIIGSGVDCIITEGQEVFGRKYHISQVENKPSDTIKSIVNMVFDNLLKDVPIEDVGNIRQYYDLILVACDYHEYQMRWKDETRASKVGEAYEYWEDLKLAFGKQVISSEEYSLISRIVMSLTTSEVTSKYFTADRDPDVDSYFQLPIYFEYAGEDCRALLDMIILNHKNKTVLPIDIKTMGDFTINFPKSLRKRRYDIQAAFYVEALKAWLQEKGYGDYKILNFKFMVESTMDEGTPLMYTCHPSLLYIGKYGRPAGYLKLHNDSSPSTYSIKQDEILGFKQLVEVYKYHVENGFDDPIIVQENASELIMDWNGIIK